MKSQNLEGCTSLLILFLNYRFLPVILLSACLTSTPVSARDKLETTNFPETKSENIQASEKPDEHAGAFSDYYLYLYTGNDIGNPASDELKSVNYKDGSPIEWGIGAGKYLNKLFSVEGTFEYWGERYERKNGPVLPGTLNNVIQAGGIGLSASAVLNYNRGLFNTTGGLGVGYFSTGILVTDPDSGLLTSQNAPSDKTIPGYHIFVGFDYEFSNNARLGFQIKHRVLNADFGSYTNGKVDLGGTWLLVILRAN